MDPHVRWLRRVLLGRIAVRVLVESSVVALATLYALLLSGQAVVVSVVAAILAGQVFAVARVASAIIGNPVNHRYLMRWEDTSDQLELERDASAPDGAFVEVVEGTGFVLVGQFRRTTDDPPIVLYSSTARLVQVVAAATGEPFLISSRLSDGRILVTTRELVAPHRSLVVNQNRRGSFAELVENHVEMLELLRRRGLHVVEGGADVVRDQLFAEWDAWQGLGPFLGPFLAVGRRPQLLVLQTRIPETVLWERTSVVRADAVESAGANAEDDRSANDRPALRLVDAA